MYRRAILVGCVALTLAACGSAGHNANPPAVPESGDIVYLLQQTTDTELRADVGGTIFKLTTLKGGKTIPTELQYLGPAEEGRIKLRVVSADREANESWRRRLQQEGYTVSTSGPVDFEHDPAKAFLVEGYKVEFLEAQASGLRYKITIQTGM